MAHGALLAGLIANRIFYLGAALPEFKVEIAVIVVFLLCVVLGPLLVFAPQLAQAKRTAIASMARSLSVTCASSMPSGCAAAHPSTSRWSAALTSSPSPIWPIVSKWCGRCKWHRLRRNVVLRLVGATLVPVVPLVLTMMSLEELLKTLFGILF